MRVRWSSHKYHTLTDYVIMLIRPFSELCENTLRRGYSYSAVELFHGGTFTLSYRINKLPVHVFEVARKLLC